MTTTVQERFAEIAKRKAAREDALRVLLLAGERPLLLTDRERHSVYLVSCNPADPSLPWRVTRFDALGAAGDMPRESFERALRAAIEWGADIATAREVTPRDVDAAARMLGVTVGLDEERRETTAQLDAIVDAVATKGAA